MSAQLRVVGSKNMTSASDRQTALDAALAQIDRAFGKGSAMKLGSREAMEVEAVSTGSLGLDIALGIGGQIGRASCRERACQYVSCAVGAGFLQKTQSKKLTITE